LFDSVDTLELCLGAANGMLRAISFDRDRMQDAAADDFQGATDVADLLVKNGVPFREAHGVVAGLVRAAVEAGVSLGQVSEADLAALAPGLDPAAYREMLADGAWLESKLSEGGTALARVTEQLAQARHVLEEAG
jgi:argininosuccinate lyase